jgi:outer membrane protein
MLDRSFARSCLCAPFLSLLTGLLPLTAADAQEILTEIDQAAAHMPAETPRASTSAWHGLLGVGVVTTQTALGETRTLPLPLVAVTYRDTFYWHIVRGGVWLLKSDDRSARLGLAVKMRRGFDPDNFDQLTGMSERDRSVEAGVVGRWRIRPITINAAYYTDVSGTTNGGSANVGVSYRVPLGERWSLTPTLSAEWLSAKVVDYYYGVLPSEATAARPAYTGASTLNLRAGVMTRYRLAREWALFGGVSYTRLGSGIADSPIVVRENVASAMFGAAWHF